MCGLNNFSKSATPVPISVKTVKLIEVAGGQLLSPGTFEP